MKTYIVSSGNDVIGFSDIEGAFSSFEKARDYIYCFLNEDELKPLGAPGANGIWLYEYIPTADEDHVENNMFCIEELEVDQLDYS